MCLHGSFKQPFSRNVCNGKVSTVSEPYLWPTLFNLVLVFFFVFFLFFVFYWGRGGGAQWLSGRVLDWRPKGRGFETHRRHCVVSLSKTQLSLLSIGSTQEDPSRRNWKIVDWDVKNKIKQTNYLFFLKRSALILYYLYNVKDSIVSPYLEAYY